MLECEVICVDRLLCHRLFFTVRLDFNNQMSHHQLDNNPAFPD